MVWLTLRERHTRMEPFDPRGDTVLSRYTLALGLVLVAAPQRASCQENAQRGAVLGGLSGALLGAGIGKHNDETAVGALVGGAVGLITGAAVGNSMDEQDAREAARRSYVQQQRAEQMARSVSTVDVVIMTEKGVSTDVIVNQIRQYGIQRTLTVQDVIALHRQGVHEHVISAMQQATVASYRPAPLPPRRPVVVHEYYHEPHSYFHHGSPWHHRHYHHGWHRPHHSGFSWGISVHD